MMQFYIFLLDGIYMWYKVDCFVEHHYFSSISVKLANRGQPRQCYQYKLQNSCPREKGSFMFKLGYQNILQNER